MTPTDTTDTIRAPDGVMDLPDRIRRIARRDPNRLALVHDHRGIGPLRRTTTTTYATLSRRAEAVAVGLRELGVREGSLCQFMIPPCEDALVTSLALWRIGAVMVGIEPHSHGLRSVARSIARVGPEFFLGSPEAMAGKALFGWGRASVRQSIVVGPTRYPGRPTLRSLERPGAGEPRPAEVEPDDPCVVAFTTGSTGNPKPVVMTHRNITAMIDGVADQWNLAAHGDIVDMPTFPIFWIIGLFHGGTVVVPPMDFALRGPGAADPAKIVATIRRHDVASFFGSPAILTNLARYCAENGITLDSVHRIVAGGAEVYGPLFAAVRSMIPHGEIYSDYGATEALPVAEIAGRTVLEETWERTEAGEGLCVGEPLAHVEVRIVDIVDGPIPTMDDARVLPTGRIGEVIVRGPHISDRYWNAPEDMAENKIVDGDTRWHRQGDTGWLDTRGRLWVCGRRSQRVVTPEVTYFPLCVEPVFNTHPEVVRSALVGVGAGGVREPVIVVETTPQARPHHDRIAAELAAIADRYDATRGLERFEFVDRIPVDKRHNAKIDRPGLAATLG